MKNIQNERAAAISLSEMMIAVVVGTILMVGVVATLVSVIPWFQDERAKNDLASVQSTQDAYYIIYGRYGSLPDLVSAKGTLDGQYVKPVSHGWEWEPATQGEPGAVYATRIIHKAEAALYRKGNTVSTHAPAYEWVALKGLGAFSSSTNDWGDNLMVVTDGWNTIQGLPSWHLEANGCTTDNQPADWLSGNRYFAYSKSGSGKAYYITETMTAPRPLDELTNAEKETISSIYAIKNSGASLANQHGDLQGSPCV